MAKACLTYLNFQNFDAGSFTGNVPMFSSSGQTIILPEEMLSESPFLDYAASNWWSHVNEAGADIGLLRPLLERFFDPDRGNFQHWTSVVRYIHGEYKYPLKMVPLHVAAVHGLTHLAAMLIGCDRGNLSQQTVDGRTALHLALENSHDDLVDILLKWSAPLGVADGLGRHPLHLAVELGNEKAVRALLGAGADVDASLSDGHTPLTIAMENKWDGLVPILLSRSGSKSTLSDGRTLLHLAAQVGNESYARKLLNGSKEDIHRKDGNGWIPLHYAADKGSLAVVNLLLQNGTFTATPDKNGWTPIHAAIRGKHLECVEALAKAQKSAPSVNNQTFTSAASSSASSGSSPPGRAQASEDTEDYAMRKFSYTVPAGTNRNIPNPLEFAVSENFLDAVNALLRYGSEKYWETGDLIAVLERSLQFQSPEILIALLKVSTTTTICKLMPRVSSAQRATFARALNMATRYLANQNGVGYGFFPELLKMGYGDVARNLLRITNLGPQDLKSLLETAIRFDDLDTAKLLVKNGAVTIPTNGGSLLCVTIKNRNYEAALFVLENWGHDRTAPLPNSETALHTLASLQLSGESDRDSNWMSLAIRLVEDGVNIAAVDSGGQNILHRAARSNNLSIVIWGLKNELAPDLLDSACATPIHVAIERGNSRVLEPLLEKLMAMDKKRLLKLIAPSTKGPMYTPILELAATSQALDALEMITKFGERASEEFSLDMDNESPLKSHYTEALRITAEIGFESGASLALKKGADLLSLSPKGYTPLHIAAEKGHYKLVPLFVQSGAKVHERTATGESALHLATLCGSVTTAQVLLGKGAVFEGRDIEAACISKNLEMLSLVLDTLPDEKVRNAHSSRAFALQTAMKIGSKDMISKLLSMASDILEFRTETGETFLHLAAVGGELSVLKQLLASAAEPEIRLSLLNAKTSDGDTALLLAMKRGNGDTVDFLLSEGANRDEALNWARKRRGHEWLHRLGAS